MRVVLIAVSTATLAIVLVVGLGGVEAASLFRRQSDQFRRSNSRCPLLPSASVVLLPSEGRSIVHLPSLLQPRQFVSAAHVARNELAAKHALRTLPIRSQGDSKESNLAVPKRRSTQACAASSERVARCAQYAILTACNRPEACRH